MFLRTVFTCAQIFGNKPERSDASMVSVIGLINTSRHAFRSMVGTGSRSQDLLGDDMIIFLTSAVVAGSNDASLECSCGESAFTISGV